jgi:hypothetical protein
MENLILWLVVMKKSLYLKTIRRNFTFIHRQKAQNLYLFLRNSAGLRKLSFVWTDKWLIWLPKYHVPFHVRVIEKECRDCRKLSLKNCWTYRYDWSVQLLRNILSSCLTLVRFDMRSLCRSEDIEAIFNLVPNPLNHIWSYRCDGCCDPIP